MQVNTISLTKPVTARPVQNFTGTYVDKLYEKVEGKEVFKNATNAQFNALRTYVLTKDYALGVTPQEAAELSKYDGDDFLLHSHDYLLKKLNIPEEIAPPFMVQDLQNKQAMMMYIPSMNIIMINPEGCEKFDKAAVFKMLRHEFQHYIQNVNILRHETFGEEAINIYKDKYMQVQRNVFETLYANNKIEQFMQSADIPMNEKAMLQYFKTLKASNNNEGINALFENISKEYVKNLIEFKDKVRKNLGVIPADSPKTKKIEVFFNEFKDLGYFNPNGEINYDKYLKSVTEQDGFWLKNVQGLNFHNRVVL